MPKADKQTPLLLKSNIVVQSQLELSAMDFKKTEDFCKIFRGLGHQITHLKTSHLPVEQLRLAFSYLSYEDFVDEYEPDLLKQVTLAEAVRLQSIPAKKDGSILTILTATPDDLEVLDFYQKRFETTEIRQLITTEREIFNIISKFYEDEAIDKALFTIMRNHPETSAHYVFSNAQVNVLAVLLFITLVALYFYPYQLFVTVFAAAQIIYLLAISFRMLLTLGGVKNEMQEKISAEEVAALSDEGLPIYTILVPVYKEPEAIPILLNSLKSLDYPTEKLDVLILLESNDKETLAAAHKADPPSYWRFVIIPDRLPKTKPKACDYGLQFARGEFVTIYDAEDLPDSDQIKKAYLAHKKMGDNCLCVQAALNYYNVHENFITSMFTLEYSYWFDYMLPGLEYFDLPIPLGGTSNHFNMKLLKKLGGWDPYNTTEDADLGIRGYFNNLTVGVVNSTTLEEANVRYGNWIRQRSRWIKGYMQTALVYNRHPLRLMKRLGFINWLSFQLLIAGTPLMLLINPLVWFFFILWSTGLGVEYFPEIPESLNFLGAINLIIGNFIAIYFNMLGVFKRKLFTLLPLAALNPFYWLFFHSVAAYKALWQLFSKPFYWEKTDHGLSQFKPPSHKVD